MDSSALKKIAEWFIKPLMRSKPRSMSSQDFIQNTIFNLDKRAFKRYKVMTSFRFLGVPNEEISKGTRLLVVYDETRRLYAIQELTDHSESTIYLANEHEWHNNKQWLKAYVD